MDLNPIFPKVSRIINLQDGDIAHIPEAYHQHNNQKCCHPTLSGGYPYELKEDDAINVLHTLDREKNPRINGMSYNTDTKKAWFHEIDPDKIRSHKYHPERPRETKYEWKNLYLIVKQQSS